MKVIEALEGFVSGKLTVMKTLFTLVKLEAELAQLSLLPFLITLVSLLVVLGTTWLSLMGLLGYLLIALYHQLLWAIAGITILNLVLLIGLLQYLQSNLKKMSFEKTRDYFSNKESKEHEQLETSANP